MTSIGDCYFINTNTFYSIKIIHLLLKRFSIKMMLFSSVAPHARTEEPVWTAVDLTTVLASVHLNSLDVSVRLTSVIPTHVRMVVFAAVVT